MDQTVLPANYTVPAFTSQAFTRWRALPLTGDSVHLTTHLSKDERLSRPSWMTLRHATNEQLKRCPHRRLFDDTARTATGVDVDADGFATTPLVQLRA